MPVAHLAGSIDEYTGWAISAWAINISFSVRDKEKK